MSISGGGFPGGGDYPGGGSGGANPLPTAQPVDIDIDISGPPGPLPAPVIPDIPPLPLDLLERSQTSGEKPTASAPPAPPSAALVVEVPKDSAVKIQAMAGKAMTLEYVYALAGLVVSIVAIVTGAVLCLNGVAGSTSWTASALGLESNINDAAPGVVLFIVGLFIVWVTKPKVRLKAR
jgi:hypothetical protein